jgi:hypothetical protein
MTTLKHSITAALGFLAIGLVAATPVSAGALSAAQPAVRGDQNADLHLTGGGSWREEGHYRGKKHYRGDRFGGHDDHYFRGHKKKKFKRAYRSGYEEGYYEGRRDGKFSRRGFSRYDGYGNRYRGRHQDHRGGHIRTPGFYFRF